MSTVQRYTLLSSRQEWSEEAQCYTSDAIIIQLFHFMTQKVKCPGQIAENTDSSLRPIQGPKNIICESLPNPKHRRNYRKSKLQEVETETFFLHLIHASWMPRFIRLWDIEPKVQLKRSC
ncbi:hypothetical protein J6590_052052 [Homalodisca vitripennis]|nr:hypothetical protein J6590_052052 [Homalodisca vitripennis]